MPDESTISLMSHSTRGFDQPLPLSGFGEYDRLTLKDG
jgi:hypothetical protein